MQCSKRFFLYPILLLLYYMFLLPAIFLSLNRNSSSSSSESFSPRFVIICRSSAAEIKPVFFVKYTKCFTHFFLIVFIFNGLSHHCQKFWKGNFGVVFSFINSG